MKIGFHIPFSGSLDRLKQKVHISRGNTFQIFARSLKGVDGEGNPHNLHKINKNKLTEFHSFLKEKKIEPIIVHAPYFYNLSQEENKNRKDEIVDHQELILEDLQWSKELGSAYYVLQPGYFKKIHPYYGIENIKVKLEEILKQTDWDGEILIKNTAGAGSEIASNIEEWNELISFHPRVKGALDFARMYSSGLDFTTKDTAENFFEEIESRVGWSKIKLLYINDTNRGCGARKQPSSPPPLGEGVIRFGGYEYILDKSVVKDKIWLVENQPKPSYYDQSISQLSKYHKKNGGGVS